MMDCFFRWSFESGELVTYLMRTYELLEIERGRGGEFAGFASQYVILVCLIFEKRLYWV